MKSVVASLLFCVAIVARADDEILTNASVIRLFEANVDAEVITLKIRMSRSEFDVSTDAIVALRRAGVPDQVLWTMLESSGPDRGFLTRLRSDVWIRRSAILSIVALSIIVLLWRAWQTARQEAQRLGAINYEHASRVRQAERDQAELARLQELANHFEVPPGTFVFGGNERLTTRPDFADALVGELRMFVGPPPADHWMPCDGRLLPVPQHLALFSVLRARYGGDGYTTFGLPDLRDLNSLRGFARSTHSGDNIASGHVLTPSAVSFDGQTAGWWPAAQVGVRLTALV